MIRFCAPAVRRTAGVALLAALTAPVAFTAGEHAHGHGHGSAATPAATPAVGAPGQKEPFFGFMSSAKFRDNKDKGYKLGLCESFAPWPAWSYTKLAMIATKTKSPNAAKLFINYILTPEGIMPLV